MYIFLVLYSLNGIINLHNKVFDQEAEMDISLVGVPIMYGCDREGVEYGPDKLREKNILKIFRDKNHRTYDFGNLYVPNTPISEKYAYHNKIKYLKPIVEINNNLSHLVYSVLSSKTFPFIIGGDHSLALGSIAGASKFYDNLAVIWLDAHGDINTCDTSPSGNFHGMPLSAASGIGDPSLINIYYNGPKINPQNIYIVGARDLDEGEIKIAKNLKLNLYTMDAIKQIGIMSTIDNILDKIKASNIDGVHLSFDIDVLDKKLVPGTGTPVSNGFSLEESKQILERFLSTGLIKSMDFVELNPLLDIDDSTADICIDLIDSISSALK